MTARSPRHPGTPLQRQLAGGTARPAAPVSLDDLPYVLVRVMESYIYLGLITGEHPDPGRAVRVISAILPPGPG